MHSQGETRMKRTIAHAIILVVVTLAAFAGAALAQDELTLESLAARVDTLEDTLAKFTPGLGPRVDTLEDTLAKFTPGLGPRVDTLEAKFAPGAPVDVDGNCRLASDGRLHISSLASYQEKYPDAETPGTIWIEAVHLVPAGHTAVTFGVSGSPNDRYVTEVWSGCDFVTSSDWWAVDGMGNTVEE